MGACTGKNKQGTNQTKPNGDNEPSTNDDGSQSNPYRVLLLGDSGVGKTSLLLRYVDGTFTDALINNIGGDFKEKKVAVGKHTVVLQIWDTAGQERFRQITSSFYRGAQGIIVVFDVTNRDSFKNLQKGWMKDIVKYSSPNVSTLIVGNKVDLQNERVVSTEDAKAYADEVGLPFMETSAKTNHNVTAVFLKMAEMILKNQSTEDS
jgi:Ras-related protein Rab-1A